MGIKLLSVLCLAACSYQPLQAQDNHLVYIDKQGVLRWTRTKQEAAFFGVNYTAPFAYSYRAHQALHQDIEQAIRQDVYHMARLGLDAFRVHVWDTEISDSLGNLLENEHLRLFDFLVAELRARNIRIIMTPIAFWGNGYPEKDERTPGFSRVFGKGAATANDTAIRAQENYLHQLFRHVNPYTHLSYTDDPDVIAVELNNEPSHSGPKSGVTAYINRLAAAIRGVGWTKPLYYNISQSPYYADAVAAANIDGVSLQWYPTGLVSGSTQKGNYLPNVDHYVIPYDTIPKFLGKSRMVYEFDAADLFQSDMYPAIARSFRASGFQWATQFAYDPMALAYANTEYQTHYLNLAYTPAKAISLLIAAEAFHTLPRNHQYGAYPSDSVFDGFRVSYRSDMSEMNTVERFYYSGNTTSHPVNAATLSHVAGVGSSPIVRYDGTGAYFLDKVSDGVWRLEVMPDVIYVRDPFERPSPSKEVSRVQWDENPMQIALPDLGEGYRIKGINKGNNFAAAAAQSGVRIGPGTYLLIRAGHGDVTVEGEQGAGGPGSTGRPLINGNLGLTEFVAPQPYSTEMLLRHDPFTEVDAGAPFTISADAAGLDTGRMFLQIAHLGGRMPRLLPMTRHSATHFTVEVPADLVTPGELDYRIILEKGDAYATFPGGWKGNPFAWDNYHDDTWKTFVSDGRLELFNPTTDRNVWIYPGFRRGFQSSYITGGTPERLILRLSAGSLSGDHILGFQYGFADKLRGRKTTFTQLIIRARTAGDQPVRAKVTLTSADAFSYSADITLGNDFQDIPVPLNNMSPDSVWIMPRPYPGFQPLWFKAGGTPPPFSLSNTEKIQVTIGSDVPASEFQHAYGLEIGSIWLQ